MNTKTANPFIYQGYEGPEFFCDRITETEDIISHMQNGRNVTLISPRRIGKTGLIKNVFHYIGMQKKDAICLYLDIFPTRNQRDLVRMLGSAVVDEVLSRSKSIQRRALEFFSSWRPVLSIDPLTGAPTVSVSIEPSNTEMTLKSIFKYLQEQTREVYIAIDEFQQITEYPEGGTEALLRSHIQFAPNVHFIFSGSKYHIMSEMFSSPQRPFYQSTEAVNLKPLHEEIYYDFAAKFFEKRKGHIQREVFRELYQRFDGYTWYIQSVLNRLYETCRSVDKTMQLNEVIHYIIAGKEPQYESIMQFLTENQFNLLRAIAHEEKTMQPTSTEFIRKYDLPGASSVKTALDVLSNRELVYRFENGYGVYDRFLNLWLQRRFL